MEELQENNKREKEGFFQHDADLPTKLTETELHSLHDELDAFVVESIE